MKWVVFVLLFVLLSVTACSHKPTCVELCKEQLTFSNVSCDQNNVQGYKSCLDTLEQSSYQLNSICANRCANK